MFAKIIPRSIQNSMIHISWNNKKFSIENINLDTCTLQELVNLASQETKIPPHLIKLLAHGGNSIF